MPELPEVEHLRQSLLNPLIGRRVTKATLHRRDVLRTSDGRRSGRTAKADLLAGGVITALDRRGKQLAIVSDARILIVRLGMTGSLVHRAKGEPLPERDHVHAAWRLDDGSRLVFRDPRRFGGLWAVIDAVDLTERWRALGPDALTIPTAALHDALTRTTRPLKAALLDQGVLAGVGNIYADEALFGAGLHPLLPANEVSSGDARCLASEIRRILRAAVRRGGSTIRDYRDGSGQAGSFQDTHAVYGRAGLPCPRCCACLVGIRVAQRQTVFCPQCQDADSRRPDALNEISLPKRGRKAQSSS